MQRLMHLRHLLESQWELDSGLWVGRGVGVGWGGGGRGKEYLSEKYKGHLLLQLLIVSKEYPGEKYIFCPSNSQRAALYMLEGEGGI